MITKTNISITALSIECQTDCGNRTQAASLMIPDVHHYARCPPCKIDWGNPTISNVRDPYVSVSYYETIDKTSSYTTPPDEPTYNPIKNIFLFYATTNPKIEKIISNNARLYSDGTIKKRFK